MDKRVMKLLGLLGATLLLQGLAGPPALAQTTGAATNTVSVSASATTDIKADVATVHLGVHSSGATAREALDVLTSQTNQVLDALHQAGFTTDQITVASVNLDRREDKYGNFLRYVASAGIEVRTEELGRVGEIIDVAVSGGANAIRSVIYEVKDKSAAVDQALTQAMNTATDKARTLAQAAGRQLGRALIIVEGNARYPQNYAVNGKVLADTAGSSGSVSNPFPISPPTLHASVNVEVTFELL